MARTRAAIRNILSVLMICPIILSATLADGQSKPEITEEDTELLLTYVVWRHGARTPVAEQVHLCHDPERLTTLSLPYGSGALTDKGKQQGFEIGNILHHRYSSFIAKKFNSTEVYFRATDYDRTQMTGLAAMASLYAPAAKGSGWNPNLAWEPVPYTTVPMTQDYMAAVSGSCYRMAVYIYKALYPSDIPFNLTDNLFIENAALLHTITEKLGANYSGNPFATYLLYDTYQSAISLGMTLPPFLAEIWDDFTTFVNEVSKKMFTVGEVVRLNSGVLLYNFLNDAKEIIKGEVEFSQRVQFYSAHDMNVAGISAAINVPPGYMKYATVLALELRKVVATGEVVVLPVLYPISTNDEVLHLQVGGCSSLFCNFDEFTALTSQNAVEESVWKEECANGGDIPLPT